MEAIREGARLLGGGEGPHGSLFSPPLEMAQQRAVLDPARRIALTTGPLRVPASGRNRPTESLRQGRAVCFAARHTSAGVECRMGS